MSIRRSNASVFEMDETAEGKLREFGDAFSDLGVGLSAEEVAALVEQTRVIDDSETEVATLPTDGVAKVDAAAEESRQAAGEHVEAATDVAEEGVAAEKSRQAAGEHVEIATDVAEEGKAAELAAPSPDNIGGAADADEVEYRFFCDRMRHNNKLAQL